MTRILTIRELISLGKTKKALDQLSQFVADKNLEEKDQVLSLCARYHNYINNFNSGIVEPRISREELNQINMSALYLLNQIEDNLKANGITNWETPFKLNTKKSVRGFITKAFNGKQFYPVVISFFIGFLVGITKLVDIQIKWENGSISVTSTKFDLSGEWEITNTVSETNFDTYTNMDLKFRLYLTQVGNDLTGEAKKIFVNCNPIANDERSTLSIIDGKIKGNKVIVNFKEGENTGQFNWEYSRDLDILKGSFSSSAALSKGSSIAERKDSFRRLR